jgi:AcrR family transcriptional regulator
VVAAMTEPATLLGRAVDERGTSTPRKRDRRGRRYEVLRFRRSGLPRVLARQTGPEGTEVSRYILALVERFHLARPVPDWAIPTLVDAGKAHMVLRHLHRLLDAEMASPEPSRSEARRLRSEIRRTTSQRRMAENILSKMVAEHRQQMGPISLRSLARG